MKQRLGLLERRSSGRTRISGVMALVQARTQESLFAVEDISSAAARLAGELPLACGELIAVRFKLDGVPITISAVVVRLEIRNGPRDAVVVAFRDVSPAIRHFLHRLVLRSLGMPAVTQNLR